MKKFLSSKKGRNILGWILTVAIHLTFINVGFRDSLAGLFNIAVSGGINWNQSLGSGLSAGIAAAVGFGVVDIVRKLCKVKESGKEADNESAETSGEK